ncbi:hypothetical protein [Priestia megaterium]|uniref:hypothetical protein n=1 Tax=Priestia megaterium TaxID=1404 RepID=UPI000BF788F1|nr:hypothetical protein [Priestia megaterium]PFJ00309.1 hypothetical protein COI84_08870 [Priestia megaterium]PGR16737.1 hypothetical protein COC62_00190 [Priestia megaterium]
MNKQMVIRDLQHKALNGDTEALDMYNQYVNRGEAPRIVPKQQFKSTVETLSMMTAGYEEAAQQRGDALFTSKPRELTHEDIMKSNPATKIAYGYSQRAEQVTEHKAKRKAYMDSLGQERQSISQQRSQEIFEEATQSKTFGEMVSSPFEKISNSYK